MRRAVVLICVLALGFWAGRASAHGSQLTPAVFAPVEPLRASQGHPGAQSFGTALVPGGIQPARGEVRESAVGWHPYPDPVPGVVPSPVLPPPALEEGVGGSQQDDGGAVIGGSATWYCDRPATCTRGYGPADLIAAVDPSTGIRRGERITVHSGRRFVTVTVVDVCLCKGSRIVDLSRLAFSRLANPSVGVIPVSITVGGPTPRVTERPLPATDTSP